MVEGGKEGKGLEAEGRGRMKERRREREILVNGGVEASCSGLY